MADARGKKRSVDSVAGKKRVIRLLISPDGQKYRIKIHKPNLDLKRSKRKTKARRILVFLFVGVVVFGTGILIISRTTLFRLYLLTRDCRNTSYIVGFQNSGELRPTGGFWGSFAYMQIPDSLKKTSIFFETNPYKKDNPLLKSTDVELPKPMKEIWPDRPQSFVNANWSADFSESAKTIEWYFGQGWNQKSDGVIAVSSLAMIDLLDLIGPITLPDQTVVRSENFTQIMSQKIDTEYWYSPENHIINEPKTLIKDLAPIVAQKAKSVPPIKMIKYLNEQIKYGRILVYLNDSQKQEIISDLGLSGEILPYQVDYLFINNANLAGHKTSLNVFQDIDYSVKQQDKKYVGELTLSRSHLPDMFPNLENKNYTRIFVPLGTKIASAENNGTNILDKIDKTDEFGRTVFGFWFSTNPGEKSTVKITYELPFKLDSNREYHLVLQKQSGTNFDNLKLDLPSGKKIDTILKDKVLKL